MDQVMMLQLIAFTVAIVEGVKVAYNGFTTKVLNKGVKVVVTVLIGTGLTAVAEFAPDAWLRIVPLLMVGLAAAGLYSIGKRSGNAILKNGK